MRLGGLVQHLGLPRVGAARGWSCRCHPSAPRASHGQEVPHAAPLVSNHLALTLTKGRKQNADAQPCCLQVMGDRERMEASEAALLKQVRPAGCCAVLRCAAL